MRNRVVAALLTLCSAAVLESQSRPLVAPAAAAIYARLLPQIETIKLFDDGLEQLIQRLARRRCVCATTTPRRAPLPAPCSGSRSPT